MPPTATATKPAGAPAGQAGQQQAVRPFPFPVGVYGQESQDGQAVSLLQSTAAQLLAEYAMSPTGWVRGVWCDFTMVVTGQATNSVSYHNDNPWSVINKVTLKDLGQQEIIGPIGGYDWMSLDKFGAYQDISDPRSDLTFTATTGTGSTAGSFTFSLYMPFEFVKRDALGVAENKSKPGWTIEIWMDSQANTYNQVPSVMGTLTVAFYPVSYTDPISGDSMGRPYAPTPPEVGTLQYWRTENDSMPAQASNFDLTNPVGFPIRNIIYKCNDASTGARSDTDFPNPFQLNYGNVILFSRSRTRWQSEIGRVFGFTNTTVDSPNSRETGVYPVWFTDDFWNKVGDELRRRYLNTNTNTLVRATGTFGATCVLSALSNWISMAKANNYARLIG